MSDAPSGPRLSFDVRSRQDQRRVVNFGVVATARVLGGESTKPAVEDQRGVVRAEAPAVGFGRDEEFRRDVHV